MMQNARINSPKLKPLLIPKQISKQTISHINELMVDKKKYGHIIINLCNLLTSKMSKTWHFIFATVDTLKQILLL
jgi:hypothetical protein